MLILALITFGVSGFVFMFIYNKLYVKELVNNGFKVKTVRVGDASLMQTKLGIPLEPLQPAAS